MDRAPSRGALVIWVTTVWRSCPARLAVRSAAWRAWREGSCWYRAAARYPLIRHPGMAVQVSWLAAHNSTI
jgi:hypothetical protein